MKALAGILILSSFASAQTAARSNGSVVTSQTDVRYGANAPLLTVPGAYVTVCALPDDGGTPCTNTVPIYQDQAKTVLIPGSRIHADQRGRYGYWTNPGNYSESFQNAQGTYLYTQPVTVGGISGGSSNVFPVLADTANGQFYQVTSTSGRLHIATTSGPGTGSAVLPGGGTLTITNGRLHVAF